MIKLKCLFQILFIFLYTIAINNSSVFYSHLILQPEQSAKHYYAGVISKRLADGSDWENQWEYTSIPWNIILPGDTLFLDGGVDSIIYRSMLEPYINGNSEAYIVITKGKVPGHNGNVIFETGSDFGANLSKSSFTEINGFIFRNIDNSKIINIRGGSHHRVKACSLYVKGYSGIFSMGSISHIEILNSYFEQADSVKKQTDLIFVRGNSTEDLQDSLIVRHNTFVCKNQSYSPHTDGLQTYLCKNTWVDGNKFYMVNNKTAYTQTIYLESSGGKIRISNNLVYAVAPATSPVVAVTKALPNIDSVFIINNTFVGNINCSKLPAVDLNSSEEQHGYLIIKNNIFVNLYRGANINVKDMISYGINYNIYYSPNSKYIVKLNGSNKSLTSMQSFGYDINSFDEKPQFNNFDWMFSKIKSIYLQYDFSLINGTMGVDDGTTISDLNTDLVGNIRPQGAGWDIGAYEINAE